MFCDNHPIHVICYLLLKCLTIKGFVRFFFFGTVLEKMKTGIQLFTKSIIMKKMITTTAALAGLFFFTTADAQLTNVRSATSASTRATVNATRATTAATNVAARTTIATNKATTATVNATRQTAGLATQSVNRVASNTHAGVGVQSSLTTGLNGRIGGEQGNVLHVSGRTESDINAQTEAKLPLREGVEIAREQKESVQEKTAEVNEKVTERKEAGLKKVKAAKKKVKEAKPSVSASGNVKVKGKVQSGSDNR